MSNPLPIDSNIAHAISDNALKNSTHIPFTSTRSIDVRHSTFNQVGRDQFNNTIIHIIQTSEVEDILASLKPAERGGYYVPPCMNGTREKFLGEIDQWLGDVDAPNVLWINGSPGSGKSTIASSLVSKLTERGILGSCFFFKRGDLILGDPAAVWRTVAYDLARFDPVFTTNLVEVLKGKAVDPGRPDIALHFNYLIQKPLTKSYSDSRFHNIPVIVIDALDECDPQPAQRKQFLDTLTQWSQLSKTFKIIVTSRDEYFIPKQFRAICKQMSIPTGDGVSADADEDIRLFFNQRFAELVSSPSFELDRIPSIEVLRARAEGLFIWASTVMRFIEQGLPEERLELVLNRDPGAGDHLTELYQQVLHLSFPKPDGAILEAFKRVLAAIVFAKGSIFHEDLPQLISESHSSVKFILGKLSSVVSIGEDNYVRISHSSFSEFLCDQRQCPEEFLLNPARDSQMLATACFRLMKDELRFNICHLETSHLLNTQVDDLPERIMANISTALLYSCRFWAAHLRDSMIESNDLGRLLEEAKDFFHHRLLFWLEVMSLTNNIAVANIALLTSAHSITVFNRNLAAFAQDASRFIVKFDFPISTSAPHIYISALPLSPTNSLVAKQYRSQFPNTLSVLSGGDQNWPPLLNIFRGHTGVVHSVAFSPDGKHVVSGSDDCTMCIWDAETGELVTGPIEGHTNSVLSVDFSPDGKWIVSGSDDHTIRIWNSNTGEPTKLTARSFNGHTEGVASVSFSPNGKRVVSGSWDGTVCIWDVETGMLNANPLKGHTESVRSVTFSPNGKHVASGSNDRTICIWDTNTSELVAGPFEGHTTWVQCVAFSPDGKRVASGSWDRTIRIWDVNSGELVAGPFEGHTTWVQSVAFSPDGEHLVSGSQDCIICIWHAGTGELVAGPFKGHTESVRSVTYSPNGRHIISGSADGTVRIWDVGIDPYSGFSNIETESVHSVARSEGTHRAISCPQHTASRVSIPFAGFANIVLTCTLTDILRITDAPFKTHSRFSGGDSISEGWLRCSDIIGNNAGYQGLLFWVPESCREAFCGPEMRCRRTTQLDLSRFVHGTSWIQCHRPSILPVTTDNFSQSNMHNTAECSQSRTSEDSTPSEANPDAVVPISINSPKSYYIYYLENTALIVFGAIVGYCLHTVARRK